MMVNEGKSEKRESKRRKKIMKINFRRVNKWQQILFNFIHGNVPRLPVVWGGSARVHHLVQLFFLPVYFALEILPSHLVRLHCRPQSPTAPQKATNANKRNRSFRYTMFTVWGWFEECGWGSSRATSSRRQEENFTNEKYTCRLRCEYGMRSPKRRESGCDANFCYISISNLVI